MYALRARQCFDGTGFVAGGATVLVDEGRITGVEAFGYDPPAGCPVTTYDGTLLPGLVDAHTHLVTDSGVNALSRVAGYTAGEIDAVVTEALRQQLAAGITTVRDLGDRDFCVVNRRDRQRRGETALEPRIVAAGPPMTSVGGHCHFLGGEVEGAEQIRSAVRERAERGVDVVKVMASGGANTPGTDVMLTQFSDDDLQLVVDESHAAGLPVTAHAHGTPSVRQALTSGVDGIEHCSCVTDRAFGDADDDLVDALGRSRVAVCPTLGVDRSRMPKPPAPLVALAERLGTTVEQILLDRGAFVGRLHRAGVTIVSGVDSGIQPGKAHGTLPLAVADLLAGGFTTTQALVSATSAAANACGLGRTTGRLRPGLDADLLVVQGDLKHDLVALRRPVAVLRAGAEVQPFT
jgi:imidazolonepropionase-like amidohydrolase